MFFVVRRWEPLCVSYVDFQLRVKTLIYIVKRKTKYTNGLSWKKGVCQKFVLNFEKGDITPGRPLRKTALHSRYGECHFIHH